MARVHQDEILKCFYPCKMLLKCIVGLVWSVNLLQHDFFEGQKSILFCLSPLEMRQFISSTYDKSNPRFELIYYVFRHAARWEPGGAAALTDFGGSVNPISTRGDTLSPPSQEVVKYFHFIIHCTA